MEIEIGLDCRDRDIDKDRGRDTYRRRGTVGAIMAEAS